MTPKNRDGIQKDWFLYKLKEAMTLDSEEHIQKILDIIQKKEGVKSQSLTAKDATFNQGLEIFGLKILNEDWEQLEETYEIPRSLIYNLNQLEKALYGTSSEAYSRIAIDYLIAACMVKHREIISKQSNHDDQTTNTTSKPEQINPPIGDSQTAPASGTPYIAPDALSTTTFQPLPIKAFPGISLSARVERTGQQWKISGISGWAMGYGNLASLEDDAVLLATETKSRESFTGVEAPLLIYLATIRQLRIQANKTNVMTQGFFSDGQRYMFMCISNNGDVIESPMYSIRNSRGLKAVFNFVLSILVATAKKSPNTSPTKQPEQDEEIKNFARDIFVKVFKDKDEMDEDEDDPENIFCDLEPGEGIPDEDFSKEE